MDEISKKVVEVFRGKIVRKDLTMMIKRGINVPSYVLEYLLGSYCSTDDPNIINAGVKKITDILNSSYVKKDEIEKIKYILRETGSYTIIDHITGTVDEYSDCYVGTLSNFNVGTFQINDTFAKQFPALFSGGIWCSIKIQYRGRNNIEEDKYKLENPRATIRKNKGAAHLNNLFDIVGIRPIQIPNIDITPIKENRRKFTLDEWQTLILRSSGIEPKDLNGKERMHFIERLVPLFEKNYNLVELGPRGTGKSYVFKEISPHSVLVSGASTTISGLFYNLNRDTVGMVGHWDCIAFDEVSGMKFNADVGVEIIKDYMASASFTRGAKTIYSDASMVFLGNINDTVSNLLKTSHLFESFSKTMRNDSAFFDRMHYYVPGWEVPKIKSSILTNEFGFISDYFSEFAREMRKYDFSHYFDDTFKLNSSINVRDEIAIRKTFSGLAKILFPDGFMTIEDQEMLLTYAIEGRRRVKEQLRKISGDEFADVNLGYIRNDGKEVIVNVPEKIDETIISSSKLQPGQIFCVAKSYVFKQPAIYKLETKVIAGDGRIEIQGLSGSGKYVAEESMNAGWKQFILNNQKIPSMPSIFNRDYFVYVNDIQNKHSSTEVTVAEVISLASATLAKPIKPYMIVCGEVSITGTILRVSGLENYVRCSLNAGAQSILLPLDCKKEFEMLEPNLTNLIEPFYYSDVVEAVKIALELKTEDKII